MDIPQIPSTSLFSNPQSNRSEERSENGILNSRSAQLSRLQETAAPSASLGVATTERFSAENSFSLTVQTQDGDNVTIEFSNSQSSSQSFAAAASGNGLAASISLANSSSSEFGFSVQGELDEDELGALSDLLNELSGIADDFFSGNIQEAFNTAAEFQLDGAELASLDFTLTQSQSYSRASVYEAVESFSGPNQALQPLQPFRDNLGGQLEAANSLFDQATDFTKSLLDNLIQVDNRFAGRNESVQQQLDDNLLALNALVEGLSTQTEDQTQA